MKKVIIAVMLTVALFSVCSCASKSETTAWWEDTFTSTNTNEVPADTQAPSPVSHLYGEWKNSYGDREIIDAETIGGVRYSVKSVEESPYGDVTVTVSLNGSDVVYTVYRYKVGYAEYSYLEAYIAVKNVTVSYSR